MSDALFPTRLDVDLSFYRKLNVDLDVLTEDQLSNHYHYFGEQEGRISSPLMVREVLMSIIKDTDDVLEIGPYTSPRLHGSNVKYFDVLSGADLVARAASIGFSSEKEIWIDYVSPNGDLSIVETASFDKVYSSHCIEHIPDLINHLNEVARILRPGGKYILVIPDKRYCFDHYVPISTVADFMQAHSEQRTTQTLGNFITSKTLTTHNDSKRHWAGDNGAPEMFANPAAISQAMQQHAEANGKYVDLHVWRFTPRSFKEALTQLAQAQFIRLNPLRVVGTVRDSNSFCAVLEAMA